MVYKWHLYYEKKLCLVRNKIDWWKLKLTKKFKYTTLKKAFQEKKKNFLLNESSRKH